ncbi:MAG TPA: DNA alkylation repair protein [Pseudobdellovibrionaceae bacterium]|nr:DNA alkylation repair protein [Pseudobdellovibrionaceae bacterium]
MEPFKNLYSYENSKKISKALKRAWADFPSAVFLKHLENQLRPLELKDRMKLLSERLGRTLPKDFPTKVDILVRALAENEKDTVGLSGFLVWPLTSLVAREGLDHFEISMDALKEMTKRFTAEFDIRPFLEKHEKKSLRLLKKWAKDPDPHVRRLVSEGTRPLLPWGSRLSRFQNDPAKTLNLLEILKKDDSEYVRRSVANHLNDHSKTHGDWVLERLRAWRRKDPDHPGLGWIVKHASRTLVKAGHPGALLLHGFSDGAELRIKRLELAPKSLKVGESLTFSVRISNPTSKPVSVLVDYVIHHRKANGRLAPKVFKGRKKVLQPRETWSFDGVHKIRKVTTRAYFEGEHLFALQINGRSSKTQAFRLRL